MKPRNTTETRHTVDPAEVRAFAREVKRAPELRIDQAVRRGPFRPEQLAAHAAKRGRVILMNGTTGLLIEVNGTACLVQDGRRRLAVFAEQIAVLCGNPPVTAGQQ